MLTYLFGHALFFGGALMTLVSFLVFFIAFVFIVIYLYISQLLLINNIERGITTLGAIAQTRSAIRPFLELIILSLFRSIPYLPPRRFWRFGLIFQVFAIEGLTGELALQRSRDLIHGFYWTFADRAYGAKFLMRTIFFIFVFGIIIFYYLLIEPFISSSSFIPYIILGSIFAFIILPIPNFYYNRLYWNLNEIRSIDGQAEEADTEKTIFSTGRFLYFILPRLFAFFLLGIIIFAIFIAFIL